MKNKGFTLVEIIVVLAIIAIGSAIVFMSINTIFALNKRQCAKNIDGALAKVKVEQMTEQGNSYIHLYTKNSGVYLDIYESGNLLTNEFGSGNKIGKGIAAYYTTTDAPTNLKNLDSTGIILAFNRSLGSFQTIGDSWKLYYSNTPANAGYYYNSIVLSGTGANITLSFSPLTGKFEYQ